MQFKTPQEELLEIAQTQVSLEALADQLESDFKVIDPGMNEITDARQEQLREMRDAVGMEALEFQDVKDMFSAAGNVAVSAGRNFMNFLDAVHRMVDSTYLVTTAQMRRRAGAVADYSAFEGRTFEKGKLATALTVGGQLPDFEKVTADLIAFSQRVTNGPIMNMATVTRRIAAKLEAKRWMGNAAFNEEVENLASIISSTRPPMDQYDKGDFAAVWPGERRMFKTIAVDRPRREPMDVSHSGKRVIDAVNGTVIGINTRAENARGDNPNIALPLLTPPDVIKLLDTTDTLLREIIRVKSTAARFKGDAVPSAISLMISGMYHGVSRAIYNFFASEDDGFGEIREQSGGGFKHTVQKDDPTIGIKNPVLGAMNVSMLSRDEESRELLALWVSRYLKLSLVDHQLTARTLIEMLLAIAKSYIEYADTCLRYYEQK